MRLEQVGTFSANRMKTVIILFVVAFAELLVSVVSVDSTVDPSGWNSYFSTGYEEPTDTVDVVDPSGWNYDRETKTSVRNTEQDRKRQMLQFCQRIVEEKDSESNILAENEEELDVTSREVKEKSNTVVENEEELDVMSGEVKENDIESNTLFQNELERAVKSRVAEIVNNKATVEGNVAFIKRFISILLESANLPSKYSEGGSDVSGVVEIIVSTEHLKTLLHFSNSSANISMRELDSILSGSIHGKYIPTFGPSELIDKIFFMASQKEVWLPFVLFSIMVYVFHLIVTSRTRTKLLTSVLLLIFTISFLVEYYKMYKEVEIKQKMTLDKYQDLPSSCYKSNENLWSHFLKAFFFNKEDKECMDYHKALLLDPLVEVSPSLVLSNILSDFVLNPFSKAGETIAAFASAILGGLPFSYGWIVWLISSIGFFLLMVFAFVIFIGGSVQFRGLFSGVSISSTGASTTTPAPARSIDSGVTLPSSGSQPLFEAVSGMSNFVLMDANSLGALVLRAQNSVTAIHSGVEELTPPADKLPSRSSDQRIDLSKLQKERLLAGAVEDQLVLNPAHKSSKGEQEILSEGVSKTEQDSEMESDTSSVKEELLTTFEVIQSDATALESTTMETDLSEETRVNSITKCGKSGIEQ